MTSTTGAIIAEVVATKPFGEPHAGSALTSYMFTGKDRDDTGLYYFAARCYDPAVGRFVTEDTWEGRLHQPASQNRYVYTINNPLRYVDPTGNTFFDVLYEWFTGGGGTSVSPSPQKPPAAGGGTGGGGGTGAPYRRTDDLDATQVPGGTKNQRAVTYSPANPGPLRQAVAESFGGATYKKVILAEDTTFYRVYGGDSGRIGSYMTRVPQNGGMQSQMDLALNPRWGNTAQYVTEVKVPKGTVVYEGTAAKQIINAGAGQLIGGGNQIYVPEVDAGWFR